MGRVSLKMTSLDLHRGVCIWPTELIQPFLMNSVVTEFHFSSLCHLMPASQWPTFTVPLYELVCVLPSNSREQVPSCGSQEATFTCSIPLCPWGGRETLGPVTLICKAILVAVTFRLLGGWFGDSIRTHCIISHHETWWWFSGLSYLVISLGI